MIVRRNLGRVSLAAAIYREHDGRVIHGHLSAWGRRFRPRKYALRVRLELGP